MRSPSDLPSEMRRSWLDEDTIDRMFAGRVRRDDAPPGYSEVVHILSSASTASDPEELAHESEHVALAIAWVGQSSASTRLTGRSKMRLRNRLRVGGLVVVGALLGSTGLAAAGVLPDAAQDAFSKVFDTVGITVPASDDHPAGSGEDISGIATTTDATGVEKGAEVSSVASGGMSQAGQHSNASGETANEGAEAAPVSVPNGGGTGTADTVSDGASGDGTEIADGASGGHASLGSGNAPAAASAPEVPEPSGPPSG